MVKSLKDLCTEAVKQDPLHSLRSWRRHGTPPAPMVLYQEPEPVSVFVDSLLKRLKLGWQLQSQVPESMPLFSPMFRANQHAPALINEAIVQHFRKLQYWDAHHVAVTQPNYYYATWDQSQMQVTQKSFQ